MAGRVQRADRAGGRDVRAFEPRRDRVPERERRPAAPDSNAA
jgi:hypothetical protein